MVNRTMDGSECEESENRKAKSAGYPPWICRKVQGMKIYKIPGDIIK